MVDLTDVTMFIPSIFFELSKWRETTFVEMSSSPKQVSPIHLENLEHTLLDDEDDDEIYEVTEQESIQDDVRRLSIPEKRDILFTMMSDVTKLKNDSLMRVVEFFSAENADAHHSSVGPTDMCLSRFILPIVVTNTKPIDPDAQKTIISELKSYMNTKSILNMRDNKGLGYKDYTTLVSDKLEDIFKVRDASSKKMGFEHTFPIGISLLTPTSSKSYTLIRTNSRASYNVIGVCIVNGVHEKYYFNRDVSNSVELHNIVRDSFIYPTFSVNANIRKTLNVLQKQYGAHCTHLSVIESEKHQARVNIEKILRRSRHDTVSIKSKKYKWVDAVPFKLFADSDTYAGKHIGEEIDTEKIRIHTKRVWALTHVRLNDSNQDQELFKEILKTAVKDIKRDDLIQSIEDAQSAHELLIRVGRFYVTCAQLEYSRNTASVSRCIVHFMDQSLVVSEDLFESTFKGFISTNVCNELENNKCVTCTRTLYDTLDTRDEQARLIITDANLYQGIELAEKLNFPLIADILRKKGYLHEVLSFESESTLSIDDARAALEPRSSSSLSLKRQRAISSHSVDDARKRRRREERMIQSLNSVKTRSDHFYSNSRNQDEFEHETAFDENGNVVESSDVMYTDPVEKNLLETLKSNDERSAFAMFFEIESRLMKHGWVFSDTTKRDIIRTTTLLVTALHKSEKSDATSNSIDDDDDDDDYTLDKKLEDIISEKRPDYNQVRSHLKSWIERMKKRYGPKIIPKELKFSTDERTLISLQGIGIKRKLKEIKKHREKIKSKLTITKDTTNTTRENDIKYCLFARLIIHGITHHVLKEGNTLNATIETFFKLMNITTYDSTQITPDDDTESIFSTSTGANKKTTSSKQTPIDSVKRWYDELMKLNIYAEEVEIAREASGNHSPIFQNNTQRFYPSKMRSQITTSIWVPKKVRLSNNAQIIRDEQDEGHHQDTNAILEIDVNQKTRPETVEMYEDKLKKILNDLEDSTENVQNLTLNNYGKQYMRRMCSIIRIANEKQHQLTSSPNMIPVYLPRGAHEKHFSILLEQFATASKMFSLKDGASLKYEQSLQTIDKVAALVDDAPFESAEKWAYIGKSFANKKIFGDVVAASAVGHADLIGKYQTIDFDMIRRQEEMRIETNKLKFVSDYDRKVRESDRDLIRVMHKNRLGEWDKSQQDHTRYDKDVFNEVLNDPNVDLDANIPPNEVHEGFTYNDASHDDSGSSEYDVNID